MNRSVLIVDDNDDIRTILSMRLGRAGFDVATAGDGAEGLAALRQQRPSCVLLDLLMPEMDGFEFLGEIQRQEEPPPPVFVVTELDDSDAREQVEELGAEALFGKAQALKQSFAAEIERRLTTDGAAGSPFDGSVYDAGPVAGALTC